MAITSRDVDKAVTTSTLASMELAHCKLTTMARVELCANIAEAVEGYLAALVDNGYTALPKDAISRVINCGQCEHFDELDGYPDKGFCVLLKMDVATDDFCSGWVRGDRRGGDEI